MQSETKKSIRMIVAVGVSSFIWAATMVFLISLWLVTPEMRDKALTVFHSGMDNFSYDEDVFIQRGKIDPRSGILALGKTFHSDGSTLHFGCEFLQTGEVRAYGEVEVRGESAASKRLIDITRDLKPGSLLDCHLFESQIADKIDEMLAERLWPSVPEFDYREEK